MTDIATNNLGINFLAIHKASFSSLETVPNFKFRLTSLAIFFPARSQTIPLPLLSALVQPSLARINCESSSEWEVTTEYIDACLSIIERQASNYSLALFSFPKKNPSFWSVSRQASTESKPPLSSFFAQFTRIEALHIPLHDFLLTDNIPRSTKQLFVDCSGVRTPEPMARNQLEFFGFLSQRVSELLEGTPNLVQVQMKHVLGGLGNWIGFRDIPRACKKRGIKLEWKGIWDQESSSSFFSFLVSRFQLTNQRLSQERSGPVGRA